MGLKDMWGMPMLNLSGLLLLALLPGRFGGRRLARIAAMATVPVALVSATYAASVLLRAERSDKPSRVLWLQDEIASRLLRAYESETGAMPRIVAGPVWEAGLAALTAGLMLRQETFRWSGSSTARPIRIIWTIVPPRAP